MKRRITLLAVLTCLVIASLVAGAFFLKLPVLVLEPGPAPDVAKRSEIAARTYPSKGSMHMTTARVNSPSGSTAVEILEGLLDGDKHVVPRESVYPSSQTEEQTKGVQTAQMTQSGSAAATAALNELGLPSIPNGVFVNEAVDKAPAARRIRAGDVITAVDGRPVLTLDDLKGALSPHKPGDEVALQVNRDGESKTLAVKTVESSQQPGRAEVGVKVSQSNQPPIEIAIDAEEIGGPSAGLMFALSIYDRLVPEDLTGGRKIAGTGTIENLPDESGKVGEVGAVDLKIKGASKIGAKVFLVPRGELAAARSAAVPGLKVIGVSTLSDAIEELKMLG
ncbi:MAG: PDZ domain-containing protein [Actinomycetota bacterium]